MSPSAFLRALLALAILTVANPIRAQTPEVGAQVFLNEPGPITATLLAAPTSPNYLWGSLIRYGTASAPDGSLAGLFTGASAVGSTAVTQPIPSLALSTPLFIGTGFTPLGPFAVTSFVSTGVTANSNLPLGPVLQTAGVVFGPNNTAQIGFAPPNSSTPASLSGYPIILGLTNVGSGRIGTVPEPSAWMLILVGLLATGLIWRRHMR
jgi:hypothetical protein